MEKFKRNKYTIHLLIFCFASCQQAYGQTTTLIDLGNQPAPKFQLLVNSPEGKPLGIKTNEDYFGKWLVLDMWTSSCTVCISSMPKLNHLQERFSEQLNVLLIGKTGTKYDVGIQTLYKRIASSEKIRLQHGFDAKVFTDYQVRMVPYVAIIRPDGKLHAITLGKELTEEKLLQLFGGGQPTFEPMSGFINSSNPLPAPLTPVTAPYLGEQKGKGYSSQVSSWQKNSPQHIRFNLVPDSLTKTFSASRMSLERLFLLAYLGKCNWDRFDSLHLNVAKKAKLSLADTVLFSRIGTRTNFIYEIKLDKVKPVKEDYQKAMQADLYTRFGYRARWIEKPFSAMRLVCTDTVLAKKLISKATVPRIDATSGWITLQHATVGELLFQIGYFNYGLLLQDSTGITYPIDINLQVSILDVKELQLALRTYGLDLIPTTRKMKVLEIYQP